ncbi:MAG TPA: hypothetical protein VGZ93_05215 [Candidatus Methylacidiphilales bacterium]|jgi:uncharacterized protein YpmS|nr:hypothetical protein [Candidatus Methylacidiphilales bacterium]
MNRIQFFILTGLSSLLLLLLIGHIILMREYGYQQSQFSIAQQTINQGVASQNLVKQLAVMILKDSAKDPGLKELMTNEKISFTPSSGDTNAPPSPAPPTSTPTNP